MIPQTPLDPKIAFVPRFPAIFYRKSFFFGKFCCLRGGFLEEGGGPIKLQDAKDISKLGGT